MVDLTDNFSTYAVVKTTPDTTQAFNFTESWVQEGTKMAVNSEEQVIDFNGTTDGTVQAIAQDLGDGNVSDTEWVLRFRFDVLATADVVSDTTITISLNDKDQTTTVGENQDSINIEYNVTGGTGVRRWLTRFSDNSTLFGSLSTILTGFSLNTHYVEIKRTSATSATWTIFSDSTFSTVLGTDTRTIPSTISSLRFIKIQSRDDVSTGGTLTGTIDNIQFWNGVSIPPVKDNFDLQESFFDDFTSYLTQPEAEASWTAEDTVSAFQKVNIRTDKMDFEWTRDGTNDSISHELGFTASDTEWTLRFKFSVTALGTQNNIVYVGLSDSDFSVASSANQDFLGVILRNTGTDEGLSGGEANGAGISQEATFGLFTWAVQDYYIEVRRTSATTYTCSAFSDVEFQTVIATVDFTTVAGVAGLDKIVFRNDDINTATGGWIGTIDDVQFWNNTPAVDDWLKQDISKLTVNRNGKTIDFDIERNGSNDGISLDLGSALSDTAWVMRIHNVSIDAFVPTVGGGGGTVGEIGMCDQDSTASDATAVDEIGFTMHSRTSTGDQHWRTEFLDGTASNAVSGRTRFDKVPIFNVGERYWLEVARTSTTTARYRIYADAGFTSLMEELTETIPATITGLRFIWFINTSGSITTGDIEGTIDKIEVLDGATEMISEDFEDDFSRGTDDWSDIGTGVGVDTANQVLKADGSDSGTGVNNQTSFDLGVGNVSNDKWTLRFKYTPTSTIQGTFSDQCRIQIGLFDLDENTDMDTAQDGIFFSHRISSVVPGTFAITDVDGASPFFGAVDDFSLTVVQGDSYFIELKRTSLTTFSCSIFTDSTYTDIVETVTGVGLVSGTQNLRFIKVGNILNDPLNNSIVQVEIDDIQFFNNVPSVPFEDDLSRIPIFTDNFNNLTFFDNFSTSANWVQTGSQVTITGGALSGWGADGTDQRITHTLAEPLSDTDWVLDFEYRFTASNNPLHRPMDITDKDQDLNTTVNDRGFTMNHNMNTFTDGLRIQWIDNESSFNQSGDIEVFTSTTYFIRIERIGGTEIVLNVYSDADRTTHITGSPVSRTDVPKQLGGLKYLVSSTNTNGSPTRTLTGTIDNLSISDASWANSSSRNYVVNGTNNNIDFDGINVTNDTIVHDLGAGVVDSAIWRLRFKLNFSTLTTGVATNIFFGLSDSDEQEGGVGLQDFIMARLTDTTDAGGQKGYGCIDADNGAPSGTGFEQLRFFTFLTGVDYFVEIKRLSLIAYTVNVFTDSSFTTSAGGVSTGVTTAGVTGLRFIKFTGIQSGATGAMIGTVDDVEFVNGEVWDQAGTKVLVNNSTEVLDWDGKRDTTNHSTSNDRTTISDSEWVLRGKISFNTITGGTVVEHIFIALSDSDNSIASSVAQDHINLRFSVDTSGNREAGINGGTNEIDDPVDSATFTENLYSQGSDIFWELKRTGVTTYEASLYSDSNHTNLIERITATDITASVNALRFIKVQNSATSGGTGAFDGTIDDIELFDGVTVANTIEKNTTSQSFDFSDATGWVQTGSNYTVDATTDQRIEMTGADGTDERVTFDLGTNGILSEEDWTIEFEYEFSAFNTPSMKPIAVSDDSGDMHNPGGVTDDAIVVNHRSITFTNEISSSHMNEGDAGIDMIFGTAIEIFVNTRYYIRLERIRATTVKISVFSDPDFTQHISGSPQTQTGVLVATDVLRFLHSQNSSDGSPTRTLTANVDNLKVYREKRANEFQDRWKEVDE